MSAYKVYFNGNEKGMDSKRKGKRGKATENQEEPYKTVGTGGSEIASVVPKAGSITRNLIHVHKLRTKHLCRH
ncbi:unnamed protein product [Oppiella nova]|uniref:Uncharacterized protein n=1 Tax=Oppiella nova TaxID=334625 RepID=A0A7R9LQZ7_9ACAR|nr:unnamed protein product [Oppiella nova]CAG2166096.1 unnamed protein product [Oppiella nova]